FAAALAAFLRAQPRVTIVGVVAASFVAGAGRVPRLDGLAGAPPAAAGRRRNRAPLAEDGRRDDAEVARVPEPGAVGLLLVREEEPAGGAQARLPAVDRDRFVRPKNPLPRLLHRGRRRVDRVQAVDRERDGDALVRVVPEPHRVLAS